MWEHILVEDVSASEHLTHEYHTIHDSHGWANSTASTGHGLTRAGGVLEGYERGEIQCLAFEESQACIDFVGRL